MRGMCDVRDTGSAMHAWQLVVVVLLADGDDGTDEQKYRVCRVGAAYCLQGLSPMVDPIGGC